MMNGVRRKVTGRLAKGFNKPREDRLNGWDVRLEEDYLTSCLGTSVVWKTDYTCSTKLQRSEPRPTDHSHRERRGGGRL